MKCCEFEAKEMCRHYRYSELKHKKKWEKGATLCGWDLLECQFYFDSLSLPEFFRGEVPDEGYDVE